MTRIKELWRSHAVRFTVAGLVLWGVVAALTDARDMFLAGNVLLTSLSVAILVAYGKVAFDAMVAPKLTRAHLLALGIFFAWAGTAALRALSVLIYGLHKPEWIGTDFSTWAIQLQLMAGVLHLAAPEVDPGGILPVREWIKMGIWAGLAVLVILAIFIWRLF